MFKRIILTNLYFITNTIYAENYANPRWIEANSKRQFSSTIDRAVITDWIFRTFSLRPSHDILGLISRLFFRTNHMSLKNIVSFTMNRLLLWSHWNYLKKETDRWFINGCEFVELYGSSLVSKTKFDVWWHL